MDLTNIKPCVECAKWKECFENFRHPSPSVALCRVRKIFVDGEDCFLEEVDDG